MDLICFEKGLILKYLIEYNVKKIADDINKNLKNYLKDVCQQIIDNNLIMGLPVVIPNCLIDTKVTISTITISANYSTPLNVIFISHSQAREYLTEYEKNVNNPQF